MKPENIQYTTAVTAKGRNIIRVLAPEKSNLWAQVFVFVCFSFAQKSRWAGLVHNLKISSMLKPHWKHTNSYTVWYHINTGKWYGNIPMSVKQRILRSLNTTNQVTSSQVKLPSASILSHYKTFEMSELKGSGEFSHFSEVFVHQSKYQLSNISRSQLSSLEGQIWHQICPSLTILNVVEHNELLPAQLLHQRQHDVIEANRWPGGQRVALPTRARVELAGCPWWSLAVPLDVQVGDVHGVCQGLQSTGWCTACRRHQRQDALVHQLTSWRGKRKRK